MNVKPAALTRFSSPLLMRMFLREEFAAALPLVQILGLRFYQNCWLNVVRKKAIAGGRN